MCRTITVGFTLGMLFGLPVTAAEPSWSEKLAASAKSWHEAKAKCGGNYTYQVRESSFTGAGQATTIVVEANHVVERSLERFGPPQPVPPGAAPLKNGPEWVEKGAEIGKHGGAAPARTVDELYAEAKAVLAAKRAEFEKFYVAFDQQNILQYCFVIDTRIADDAPRQGVKIDHLKLGGK